MTSAQTPSAWQTDPSAAGRLAVVLAVRVCSQDAAVQVEAFPLAQLAADFSRGGTVLQSLLGADPLQDAARLTADRTSVVKLKKLSRKTPLM